MNPQDFDHAVRCACAFINDCQMSELLFIYYLSNLYDIGHEAVAEQLKIKMESYKKHRAAGGRITDFERGLIKG